jgi:hypothetical protein
LQYKIFLFFITPHGTLKIKGGKLKIAGDNPEIGVWFEDEKVNHSKLKNAI